MPAQTLQASQRFDTDRHEQIRAVRGMAERRGLPTLCAAPQWLGYMVTKHRAELTLRLSTSFIVQLS
jgi:hypothetical protein